ncbi:MAG: hypothetical protein IKQ22_08250 [Clostridia bacterium]|nr:hypothetical protein [Clostridia bacterium]
MIYKFLALFDPKTAHVIQALIGVIGYLVPVLIAVWVILLFKRAKKVLLIYSIFLVLLLAFLCVMYYPTILGIFQNFTKTFSEIEEWARSAYPRP